MANSGGRAPEPPCVGGGIGIFEFLLAGGGGGGGAGAGGGGGGGAGALAGSGRSLMSIFLFFKRCSNCSHLTLSSSS